MISMIEHIEYLISTHDCVIVPGYGAFIAQYTPATICSETSTFSPPIRSISFNQSINHNDGLLANSIARKDNVSYDDALRNISHAVNALNNQLKECNTIQFGCLGIFRYNTENSLIFEPSHSNTAMAECFGFKKLPILTLEQLSESTAEIIDIDRVSYLRKIRAVKYAASIILLIALSFVLTTPISFDKSKSEFASMSIVKDMQNIQSQNINDSRVLYISYPKENIEKDNNVSINASQRKKSTSTVHKSSGDVNNVETDNTEGKYCLIVASLPSYELAAKHIAESKNGSNMRIMQKDGKYRVYVASNDSYKVLETKRSHYKESWICKR